MLLFNIILIIHVSAFLLYLCRLALLFPIKQPAKDKWGLPLGILILCTGIALVALKYPAVNYYKIVPKLSLFLLVGVINGIYDKRPLSRWAYYLLLGATVLAALIAVVKV
ncbi:hypothetical protein [Chitinophaga eiseniae]|uniref:Uncharacterized protein n=1 Tax=Chitinophaga eiseniae TaxID=634771 RepID=A0A847SVR1_9BACT|nr:hypothetical protein [Chitinophaga eiseniae]NLR80942.1 hypothetical protein [Chitinophaga eiseniae]